MLHRTWSTRNDYERKINYDWPYRMDKISKTKKQNKTNKQKNKCTFIQFDIKEFYITHILHDSYIIYILQKTYQRMPLPLQKHSFQ